MGSLEFSKLLVEKADVAVAPGIGFGEHGDDCVRIALVENEQRIRQAAPTSAGSSTMRTRRSTTWCPSQHRPSKSTNLMASLRRMTTNVDLAVSAT